MPTLSAKRLAGLTKARTKPAAKGKTPKPARGPSKGEAMLDAQIAACRLPSPEREYRFHPVRMWRFDRCWPQRRIAVEIEGGIWIAGAHTRGKHFESDAEKYNEAALLGWVVIRVSTGLVKDGRAIETLRRALA